MQDLYKLWFNKIKTFVWPGYKYSLKVTDNTYSCELHLSITGNNVSAGRNINTLKPSVVPSVFTCKRNHQKTSPCCELVKTKRKKSPSEINDADIPPDRSFQN